MGDSEPVTGFTERLVRDRRILRLNFATVFNRTLIELRTGRKGQSLITFRIPEMRLQPAVVACDFSVTVLLFDQI